MAHRSLLTILVFLFAPASAVSQQPTPLEQLQEARYTWNAGHYAEALTALGRLLTGPAAEALREPIALLTGELFRVTEITEDGQAVRWSPNGTYAVYETGTGMETRSRILAMDEAALRPVAEVPGRGLVFSPSGTEVAYLTTPDTEEYRTALAALEAAAEPRDRRARRRLEDERERVEALHTRVVIRELVRGTERLLTPTGIGLTGLLYDPSDGSLYGTGFSGENPQVQDLFNLGGRGHPDPLRGAPWPRENPRFTPDGTFLVFQAEEGSIGITEMATGRTRILGGSAPTLSADGSTLGFLGGDAGPGAVSTLRLTDGAAFWDEPRVVANSPDSLSARTDRACSACPILSGLALSSDGSRVVFQAMPREDWELFLADGEGGEGENLTREVQHDLYPFFLADGRLLAMKGEGRHRRAHLYDLDRGGGTRLFRNNTIRTVAPEYEWALSPDGGRLLMVAERDGDTVSPERGVYLLDLTQEVGVEELLARVRTQLSAERDLRQRGERMYRPVEEEVREVVNRISTPRIFEYEEALFRLGSKHISQPGNARAIDYLTEKLREFGYEPELQWFEPRGTRTANVVVRLEGTTHPEVVYAVSAHFDSNSDSPGADDNTSATVGLLEMARVLKDHPLPATLEIAFFTGEEAGLLGSREYVRRAQEGGKQLVGALNNDMVGWAEDFRLDNTIRYSNVGIRDLQHAAAFLFSDLVTYDARYYKSTDAAAYYDAYGDILGGIGSYPILASPHYHQPHDVLETVNHQLVAEVARVTSASAILLASSPSPIQGLEARREGDRVVVRWTSSPERDVVEYRVRWGPPGEEGAQTLTARTTQAFLEGVSPGSFITVKAVNRRGMEGWDWAKVEVGR